MPFEELIVAVIISLVTGFVLGYFYIRPRITSIEDKYRAELEKWKIEAAAEIRKDSKNRSRSTLKGRIAEQMAPILPEFSFNPADARFVGSPVDYIIFDGLTEVADEKKQTLRIIFMDVKKGNGDLTRTQRVIKKAVEDKAVAWETLRLADE
jgi:predicted Holliday junction resolvase-like endonuclease